MITANMRLYDYYTIGAVNEYGQQKIPTKDDVPVGQIKMNINITSQSIQDNINYKNCNYIGLTRANVDDTYIIKYGNELLKVLYVNPIGRMNQVYLGEI